MAKYVDGFVLVVPNDKTEEYKKMAEGGHDSWMKHGALAYFECRGDDLITQEIGGKRPVNFPKWPGQASIRQVVLLHRLWIESASR